MRRLIPVQSVPEDALRGFRRLAQFRGLRVGRLVPEGFEKYARIFHPASLADSNQRTMLRWVEMAKHSGAKPHPLMQWNHISMPAVHGAAVEPPDTGTLPCSVSQPLKEILSRHSKHKDCWLGIWRGWGWKYPKYVPETVSVDIGFRDWDIFRAPIVLMDMPFFDVPWEKTANLIWRDDLGWWITTDIDLDTSYIGGDGKLIQAVLESPELEAMPVVPEDGITICSDKLNSD